MCIHPKILLSHDFALVFWDETWQQHIMWSPGLKSGVIFPEYRHLSAFTHMTSSAKCKVWRYSKDPSSHQRSQQEPAAIQHHHRHSFKITPCKQTDFHGMQMVWRLYYHHIEWWILFILQNLHDIAYEASIRTTQSSREVCCRMQKCKHGS